MGEHMLLCVTLVLFTDGRFPAAFDPLRSVIPAVGPVVCVPRLRLYEQMYYVTKNV
jgi:hypothetical protein